MQVVQISESAFEGFQRRAVAVGMTVDQYLDEIGSAVAAPNGFVMTPEIRLGIERGLERADSGQTVTLEASRSRLDDHKAKWRKNQSA